MAEVGEEVVVKRVEKKKHKKRKHGELGDSGGDNVSDVQLDRKKSKSERSSGDCVSQAVDEGADVSEDKRSRKEKKKEKNRLKSGDENKFEKMKSKESGNGVEGGDSRGKEASDGMDCEEGDGKSTKNKVSSGVMGSKVELKKDKKEKKKKGKSETKNIENGDTSRSEIGGLTGSVEKQIGDQGNEKVDVVETKKEKKRKSKSESKSIEDGDASRSETGIHTGTVEKQVGKQGNEKIDLVENTKQKKKVSEEEGPLKKKKKSKEKHSEAGLLDKNISDEAVVHSENEESREATGRAGLVEDQKKDKASKKRKKKQLAISTEEKNTATGVSATDEGNEPTVPGKKSKPGKKSAKVRFSDSVEVFPLPENSSEEEDNVVDEGQERENYVGSEGIIQGKRYSKEEDELIRKAVLDYIEDRQLGEDGVKMVMRSQKHKQIRGCWDVIIEALPWRTKESIYGRAHILFERSETNKWTKEDLETVREYYEKHGPKWRELADEMGRNRTHVKDAFRQIKLAANRKKGPWSQQEYQTLFDSVNKSLRIRASMDRKSQHGMLRDNIGWEAVSKNLGTRTDPVCCIKWYDQLTSTLVKSGDWADSDDHRLLMALVDIDATCEEEVDWDNILEHRPGDVCRKRWNQMVRHIGEHGNKSFSEQVEILHQRYAPDVLEAREIYESKPFVD